MTSLFRRFFKRLSSAEPKDQSSFAARVNRFRLFLGAHIDAYSEMMNFEERLAGQQPVGMPFLRMCTAKLTVAVLQCILQLNAMSGGRYNRLQAPFAALRSAAQEILAYGAQPLEGALALPLSALSRENSHLVSPGLIKLGAVGETHPEFVPAGFVVTGAAWWRYFNDPDMHDEIDRIMLISQEDPNSYSEAGARIRERIMASFPLSEELCAAVRVLLDGMREELQRPGRVLLVRCFPVRQEHGALVMPEQILRTPLDDEKVFAALRSALAMTYQARAMIYRLKLGIRDRAMPFCICCTVLAENQARGSAHRGLGPDDGHELMVHVRRGIGRADASTSQYSAEDARLPAPLLDRVRECCIKGLDCLADAPVSGNRHELFWAVSDAGDFYALTVNALPDPDMARVGSPPGNLPCPGESVALQGGVCACPGFAEGKTFIVRNLEDALHFPIGSILLVPRTSPRWTFLLDFAVGAVAGDGTGNGLFARTARRYGRPAILHQPAVLDLCASGEMIRLTAESSGTSSITLCQSRVCQGGITEEPAGEFAVSPDVAAIAAHLKAASDSRVGFGAERMLHNKAVGMLWLPSSDLAHIAGQLAPKVMPLTLPESESPDFRAENCATFHDFITYCHDQAVQELYRIGVSRKTSQAPAKQLICDVPKQFWVIDLGSGFREEVSGPSVRLDQIASLPMHALWDGFSAKPWDGPPQLDAKGFLSVLFEATANPNLEPASQSAQYTEKNVFLVGKHFCSMRCRFGFHFLSLDCFLSERPHERFIIFQFKGGAANLSRRIRRVHFVAELLAQFDFAAEIVGDTLSARLEQRSEKEFLSALRVIGYLVMHTRQLDMIMADESALTARRVIMLEDMLALAAGRPLVDPAAPES